MDQTVAIPAAQPLRRLAEGLDIGNSQAIAAAHAKAIAAGNAPLAQEVA